jgi:hypothetical protein
VVAPTGDGEFVDDGEKEDEEDTEEGVSRAIELSNAPRALV